MKILLVYAYCRDDMIHHADIILDCKSDELTERCIGEIKKYVSSQKYIPQESIVIHNIIKLSQEREHHDGSSINFDSGT